MANTMAINWVVYFIAEDVDTVVAVVAAVARAEISDGGAGGKEGGGGWLGRLVQYHKEAFLRDYEKWDNTNLVDIKASVEEAPEGYTDPPGWDEPSVLRLLDLVARSKDPSVKPVKRALRRALRPTRRFMPYIPPGMNSRDLFPSLTGHVMNFIYNDYYYSEISSSEDETSSDELRQREWERKHTTVVALNVTEQEKLSVLVVRNPVEARLPSARISVRLLRKIMEERAMAARVMTPSTRRTRTWLPRHNTTFPVKKANDTSTTLAPQANDTATTPAGEGPKEEDKKEDGKEDSTDAPAAGGAAASGAAAGAPAADGAAADGAAADAPAADEKEGGGGRRGRGRAGPIKPVKRVKQVKPVKRVKPKAG